MRRKVRFSRQALADLDDIVAYVKRDSARVASALLDRLYDGARHLDLTASQYSPVKDYPESGLRRRVVGSYNIYFNITDDKVQVVRILHGARDIDRLLFPDD